MPMKPLEENVKCDPCRTGGAPAECCLYLEPETGECRVLQNPPEGGLLPWFRTNDTPCRPLQSLLEATKCLAGRPEFAGRVNERYAAERLVATLGEEELLLELQGRPPRPSALAEVLEGFVVRLLHEEARGDVRCGNCRWISSHQPWQCTARQVTDPDTGSRSANPHFRAPLAPEDRPIDRTPRCRQFETRDFITKTVRETCGTAGGFNAPCPHLAPQSLECALLREPTTENMKTLFSQRCDVKKFMESFSRYLRHYRYYNVDDCVGAIVGRLLKYDRRSPFSNLPHLINYLRTSIENEIISELNRIFHCGKCDHYNTAKERCGLEFAVDRRSRLENAHPHYGKAVPPHQVPGKLVPPCRSFKFQIPETLDDTDSGGAWTEDPAPELLVDALVGRLVRHAESFNTPARKKEYALWKRRVEILRVVMEFNAIKLKSGTDGRTENAIVDPEIKQKLAKRFGVSPLTIDLDFGKMLEFFAQLSTREPELFEGYL